MSETEEAVIASGGQPGGVSPKIHLPLEFEQRADVAVVAVLRALFDVVEANLGGTVNDLGSEFLHDLRVSVRRSRSVQREFKRVFPPADLEHFRHEFRWLQQLTGEPRDMDVYVLEFNAMRTLVPAAMRADLDPLLELLRRRRLAARAEMIEGLRSERFMRLRAEWLAFLDLLPVLPLDSRPDAARTIGSVSGQRIARVYRRMVRMGSGVDERSPAADYHELRKKGKGLRYLLELFGAPLYPADVVKPMVKALKALQDVLGRHQDREVQVASLRAIGEERGQQGSPSELMAMGALVTRLVDDEQAARAEFAQRFAEFAAPAQWMRVTETFASPLE